jgi:hypothetical protein
MRNKDRRVDHDDPDGSCGDATSMCACVILLMAMVAWTGFVISLIVGALMYAQGKGIDDLKAELVAVQLGIQESGHNLTLPLGLGDWLF